MLEEENMQLCPKVTHECGNRTVDSLAGSLVACCILVTGSTLSCLGAVLIIVAYLALKDIRKGAQTIITYLAVADFIYSASLIIAGINYFSYYRETVQENCEVYQTVCKIQGFITILGSWSTFVWTSVLAFYFFMQYVFKLKGGRIVIKYMPLYHLMSWGLPVVIGFPLLVMGKLGLYPGWLVCSTKPQGSSGESILLLLLGGWLPELISCAFVITLYTVISIHLCKQRWRSINLASSMEHVEKTLLLIPIIYIFLRIWNSAEYILLSQSSFESDFCSENSVRIFFYIITNFQVVADSSQGWINAILYVFLSRKMRDRLFWKPLGRLAARLNCKRPRHSSNGFDVDQRPSSEATPLVDETALISTTHGYDTFFSFPTEFPSSQHNPSAVDQCDHNLHSYPAH